MVFGRTGIEKKKHLQAKITVRRDYKDATKNVAIDLKAGKSTRAMMIVIVMVMVMIVFTMNIVKETELYGIFCFREGAVETEGEKRDVNPNLLSREMSVPPL